MTVCINLDVIADLLLCHDNLTCLSCNCAW